jgi:prolipoprotein diacylglyceryltransferase
MIGNILGSFTGNFSSSSIQSTFEFTGFQGLASHGAAISIIVAMYFLVKKYYNAPTLDLRPNSNSSC